jgi:hypothetical protein
MFNPLHAFEPQFLERFRQKGVKAFVKQTYKRGRENNPESPQAFILIHFENLLAAQQYYDVIKHDENRDILKIDSPDDLATVKDLLETAKVFTMLKIKDAEGKARKILDKRIRAFIEYKLNWRPGREDDLIFTLDVQFGEIYANLKFRSKEIKVKLEEIENASYVL